MNTNVQAPNRDGLTDSLKKAIVTGGYDPNRLQKIREQQGVDRKTLSQNVSFAQSTLEKIESGHYDPSIDMIREIASALSLNFERFVNVVVNNKSIQTLDNDPVDEDVDRLAEYFERPLSSVFQVNEDEHIDPIQAEKKFDAAVDLLLRHGSPSVFQPLNLVVREALIDHTADAESDERFRTCQLQDGRHRYLKRILDIGVTILQKDEPVPQSTRHRFRTIPRTIIRCIMADNHPGKYTTLLKAALEAYYMILKQQARSTTTPHHPITGSGLLEKMGTKLSFEADIEPAQTILSHILTLNRHYDKNFAFCKNELYKEKLNDLLDAIDFTSYVDWLRDTREEATLVYDHQPPINNCDPLVAITYAFEQAGKLDNITRYNLSHVSKTTRFIKRLETDSHPGLPEFDVEEPSMTSHGKLDALIDRALNERNIKHRDEIKKQAEYELSVIKNHDIADYFLILTDVVRWGRSEDGAVDDPCFGKGPGGDPIPKNDVIYVSPGRGSAAGSAVNYLLGITELNPVEHNLSFTKFFNPEVQKLPDVDLDFDMAGRDYIFDYLEKRWGADNVLPIYADKQQMTSHAAARFITSLPVGNSDVCERLRRTGRVRDADLPPITTDRTANSPVGTKFDFLGLKALNELKQMLIFEPKLRDQSGYRMIDVPIDDEQTFETLCRTIVNGDGSYFQLKQDGLREYIKRLAPDSINQLADIMALYRPGPLHSGLMDEYIKRATGKSNNRSLIPEDDSFNGFDNEFNDTHGLCLYQEQFHTILEKEYNISTRQADKVWRAIGKKGPALTKKYKKQFGESDWETLQWIGEYAFNRSHATSYAYITYYQAYCDTHYPDLYCAAKKKAKQ